MSFTKRVVHRGATGDDQEAGIYTRVSTEEQSRFGVSLDAQEARARSYCDLHGFRVVDLFRDEGVSGAKPLAERPEGQRLVLAASAGEIRHVVALKLDRLFRDAIDCLDLSRRWELHGVAMHLIDLGGQAVDSASAMGRFMLTVVAGAAEMERNLIRERTRTALQHKRARGDRLGTTPMGFLTPGPGEPMIPVKSELETVRIILRLRAKDPTRWTFRAIAEHLVQRGSPTKRGGRWDGRTVKSVWDRRDRYAGLIDPA